MFRIPGFNTAIGRKKYFFQQGPVWKPVSPPVDLLPAIGVAL